MGYRTYIGGSASGAPKVWEWDGSSLTDLSVPVGSSTFVRCLYHDGEHLFAGMDDGRIHAMDREGNWTSNVFVSTDTAKHVCSIIEYADPDNGNLYFALQGLLPDHAGGNAGALLWYAADPIAGPWTQVTGLSGSIAGALSLQKAGGFLGLLTHITGRVWVNRGSGSTPLDATVGANWTSSFAPGLVNGHYSYFWFGDIAGEGDYYYAGRSDGNHYRIAVIDGTAWGTWGTGWFPPHPAYGPHSVDHLPPYQTLGFDATSCLVGFLNSAAWEEDLPGTGGEPAGFFRLDGDMHLAYTASGTSYIYQRQGTSWTQLLADATKVFYDVTSAPLTERTPLDVDAGICQCRIEPQVIDPLEGDFVFLLGSEVHEYRDVEVGDKINLSVQWDFTTSPLASFGIFMRFRPHDDILGDDWQIVITVAGTTWIVHDLDWDFDQGWIPLRFPTGKVTGTQTITFTLERK